jgi:pimeloyl-ACP methyl ester carboxylesterase
MSHLALYQQAIKTRALVNAYYGKAPKFVYYDGHSQGGRQVLKVAQERPELYDGYLIAQPAVSVTKFSLSNLYPQVVIKSAQGITAAEKTCRYSQSRGQLRPRKAALPSGPVWLQLQPAA